MIRSPRPPVARPASPLPPPGRHDLSANGDAPVRVAVDTNVVFHGEYCQPLAVSAELGDLEVYWSPMIQREIAKVTYREHVLAALRASSRRRLDSAPALRQLFDAVAVALDGQMTDLERTFRFAPTDVAVDEATLLAVADTADRPILRAALAAGASYLLSLDEHHFPHGTIVAGVRCWHPDTFLTLFYRQNPGAYVRASRGVTLLSGAITRRLLP